MPQLEGPTTKKIQLCTGGLWGEKGKNKIFKKKKKRLEFDEEEVIYKVSKNLPQIIYHLKIVTCNNGDIWQTHLNQWSELTNFTHVRTDGHQSMRHWEGLHIPSGVFLPKMEKLNLTMWKHQIKSYFRIFYKISILYSSKMSRSRASPGGLGVKLGTLLQQLPFGSWVWTYTTLLLAMLCWQPTY